MNWALAGKIASGWGLAILVVAVIWALIPRAEYAAHQDASDLWIGSASPNKKPDHSKE